jgi:hypothetical protein
MQEKAMYIISKVVRPFLRSGVSRSYVYQAALLPPFAPIASKIGVRVPVPDT